MCPTIVSGIVSGDALVANFSPVPSNNPRSLCQGSYASWKPLKTLEFQESDFKALKVLEFRFRSLKVLEFLLNKIENVLHNL